MTDDELLANVLRKFLTAERIVRALAAIKDPTVDDRDYSPWSECGLCGVTDPAGYVHEIDDPLKHEESCPWRMARLLVGGDHSDGEVRAP